MMRTSLLCSALLLGSAACVDGSPTIDDAELGELDPPETVGRTVVHFPDGPQLVTYEVHDGRALMEGDIDLGAADAIYQVAPGVEAKDVPAHAWTSFDVARWPSSTIRYVAPSRDLLGTARYNAIYQAIADITNETQLNFQVVSSSSTSNRIYFTNALSGSSSSAVGMQGGSQAVRLTLTADVTTIKHELLHAAGFWHEHSRTDRGPNIDINWGCIEPGQEHNFESHAGVSTQPYDVESIMHYRSTAFVRDAPGCTWTIRRENGDLIGRNTELSTDDIKSINFWY